MIDGIAIYMTKNIPNAFFLWKPPFPTKSMDKLKDLENFCTRYFPFSSLSLGHKAEMFPSGSFRKEKRGGERDLICQKGEEGSFSPFFQWGKGRWVEGKISLFEKGGGGVTDGSNLRNKMTCLPTPSSSKERGNLGESPPSSQFFFSGLCFGVWRCETKNKKKYG